jgi:hypothetical protein
MPLATKCLSWGLRRNGTENLHKESQLRETRAFPTKPTGGKVGESGTAGLERQAFKSSPSFTLVKVSTALL